MATVAPAPVPRSKFDARVETELGKAVSHIRANDLWLGGLAVATLTLAHTVGMVLLDRWLLLPMAARQVALAGFVAAMGAVGYLFVVRPLRRAINPRYAARRVEATLADSKNAVINWVDLQDRDLPATVRAAVGQRAAGDLQSADVAKATETRSLVWLGAAVGLLAATLCLMLVIFKQGPFVSLVKRTFSPFVAREVASRTTLTLTEPAGGDATVTAGESLTIAAEVTGSVPAADSPTRPRVQVWHTDGATEFDELPLEPGSGSDWRLTVPPSVIQNGFQYRVVAGDTRTADFRVTVRNRPLVTGFEARYESPAYTRIPLETGREPKLEGYRGTRVTLTVRTNRPVKRGWLEVRGKDPVSATADGEAMRFELTLADAGSYRLGFTTADDETAEPTPYYPISVLVDQPPLLTITKPAEDEGTLPANGTLAVDGEVADDFGVVGVTLKMRVVSGVPFDLPAKPYRPGKSFKRADGTYPTRLADGDGSQTGYRDTVELAGMKDRGGQPVPLAADMVIEYWLEATDNCTEPRPNVGTSAKKRVKLTPAVTDATKRQEQAKQAADRKAEQQKHEQAQDKQLEGEKRDPKQLRPEADKPPEQGNEATQPGDKGAQPENGQPQQGGDKPQPGDNPDGSKPQTGDKPQPGDTGKPQTGDQPPKKGGEQPSTDQQSKTEGEQKNGKPDPAAKGSKDGQPGGKAEPSPADKKLDEQKDKVERALKGQEGSEPPETAPQPSPSGGGQSGSGSKSDAAAEKERQKQVQQAIDDLNGSDPDKQEAARKKLDDTLGDDQRKRIEKIQKGLKSDDPKEREEARKAMGELDRETGANSAGIRGDRKEDVERLSRELNSQDQGTRESAEKQAEKQFGQQGRDQLKETGKKLDSPDQQQREEAKKDVDQLIKKEKNKKPQEQPAGDNGQPKGDKPSPADQVRQQANDLNSSDPGKREAAEKAMDQKMGPEARKDLQQKLGSQDAKEQQAGKQQVEDMAKQAGTGGEPKSADKPKGPTKEDIDRAAETARDLTSPDNAKREAAEKALDKQMGPDKRKELQKNLNDLKNGTPEQQAEAAKNLEQMAKDAAAKNGQKPPTPEQAKELADAAKKLNSPDPAERKAAEDKLDNAIGKPAREQLQKEQAAKQPDPKAARDATEQAMSGGKKDAAEAERKAKELADAAKDLNSPDKDKREAAEKQLDKDIGPQAREQLQQLQKDMQSDDPKKREAAQQQIKDALDNLKGKFDPKQPWRPGGRAGDDRPEDRYKDDPANRLKAAELQLTRFKEARGNEKLLKDTGMTPAEYEALLRDMEKRLEQLRQKTTKPRTGPERRDATGPPTLTTGGGNKVEKRDNGPTTGGAGAGAATPGYGDAQKRFGAKAATGGKKPAETPPAPKQP